MSLGSPSLKYYISVLFSVCLIFLLRLQLSTGRPDCSTCVCVHSRCRNNTWVTTKGENQTEALEAM